MPPVPTEEFEAVRSQRSLLLGILDRLVALRWWLLVLILLGMGYHLHILPRNSAEALLWIREIGNLFPHFGG